VYSEVLGLEGEEREMKLDSSLQELNVTSVSEVNGSIGSRIPETNTTSETNTTEETNSSVDTINYGIKFSLEDEEVMKFNLEDKKNAKIALIDKDTQQIVPDRNIVTLKVISQQDILKIFDNELNTVPTDVISYSNKNNIDVFFKTYTSSGLVSIDVEIEYINAKGSQEKIKKTYSTMIMSGPPTAFSINDAGVKYNFDDKWFEHEYLISATDKYNNMVNISPTIYVNAMTDFTKDSAGNPILYGKFGSIKGNLIADKDNHRATLETNRAIFNKLDYDNDYVLIFGDKYSYEALGKWDIDRDLSSDTALVFSDIYNGQSHSNLGFAVGHNSMDEICSSSFREWHVTIDSSDGKYTLDNKGQTKVIVRYPAEYLYGKLGAISVNFLGKNTKTGEILKSGEVYFDVWNNVEGLEGKSYKVPKGSGTTTYRHYGIINTGTGDKFALKNSHFSCNKVEVSDATIVSITRNKIITNDSQCATYGERAYIEYTLKALPDKDGSISFSECYVDGVSRF